MTLLNTMRAELLDEIRVNRERLLSQEQFLEQLKATAEGVLSKEQLMELVSAYRDSLSQQEKLLQEILPLAQPTLWSPKDHAAAASSRAPTLKLRRVAQVSGSISILARLRNTWVGGLYVNHLKRHTIIRWLTIQLWRKLYPVYTNNIASYLGARTSKRWRPLVKLSDHVKKFCLPTTKIFDSTTVDTPVPIVVPDKDQEYLVPPHDRYVFPSVYVAQLSNSFVYGGTNLVFTQDAVICHDLYDFERDYTSEELHGRHLIDAKNMRMRLLRNDATPESVEVAAAFVDACAPNYAHWMTEVLPRIAAFCSLEQFAGIPLIINDGLHRNIIESLALICGSEREVITLPIGRALLVDRLYVTSVAGYVPFERRNEKLVGHSHGLFCPAALELIRNKFLSDAIAFSSENYPKKIYLLRVSNGRNVTNRVELEDVLLSKGYVVVQPEKLTFIEQVKLFRNASDIVGSSGAALVNLIFSPRKVNCQILIAKLDGTSYWYWQNIAAATGNVVTYFLGDLINNSTGGIHGDFYIDLEDFKSVL